MLGMENSIGRSLDPFVTPFNSICEARALPCTPDAFSHLAQEGKIPGVFGALFRLTVMQMSRTLHLIFCLL